MRFSVQATATFAPSVAMVNSSIPIKEPVTPVPLAAPVVSAPPPVKPAPIEKPKPKPKPTVTAATNPSKISARGSLTERFFGAKTKADGDKGDK